MNREEVLKLNEQMNEAWNLHSEEKFVNACNENVLWKINGGKETYRGKKELKEYFNMWKTAFPDLHLTMHSKIATDDAIAVEYEFSGTHKGKFILDKDTPAISATNQKINLKGCYMTRVANGKISETNLYPDRFALLEQLGVVNELMQNAN